MNTRKKAAMKNSAVGLIGQISSLIIQIISRKYFLEYIGEEILGMNGTFTQVLSTLSLTELGVQHAVTVSLYRPFAERDEKKINEIVNVFKTLYRAIGVIFIVLAFATLPFLDNLLTGVDVTRDIYLYFLIHALSPVCSYFLAYKRIVLYADQKEYVYKLIDIVANIVFKCAQIYVIIKWQSYYAYIILFVVEQYLTNIIVHFMYKKQYPYIKREKFNKECAYNIFRDIKEVFVGKFAAYVYSSTDSLIISKVLGTATVAFIGNYTSIVQNIKYLVTSMMAPLTPIVGNFVAETKDKSDQKKKFMLYSHMRYVIGLLLLVPTMVLINDFIEMWVGAKYILSDTVRYLLIIDVYLGLIAGACTDFIMAQSLFKDYKKVTVVGSLMNLILSLLLVKSRGLEGILFGTVCGQLYYVFGYSYAAYRKCFEESNREYGNYLLKNIGNVLIFAFVVLVCGWVYSTLPMEVSVIKFLLGGIVCVAVTVTMYLLIFFKNEESVALRKMALSIIKRKSK